MKAKKRIRKKSSVRMRGRPHPADHDPEEFLSEPDESMKDDFRHDNEPDNFKYQLGEDEDARW